MKKTWAMCILFPCLAFSANYVGANLGDMAVCEHCGAFLEVEEREDVVFNDERDEVAELRVAPSHRAKPSERKSRLIQEKRASHRPKVIQRPAAAQPSLTPPAKKPSKVEQEEAPQQEVSAVIIGPPRKILSSRSSETSSKKSPSKSIKKAKVTVKSTPSGAKTRSRVNKSQDEDSQVVTSKPSRKNLRGQSRNFKERSSLVVDNEESEE